MIMGFFFWRIFFSPLKKFDYSFLGCFSFQEKKIHRRNGKKMGDIFSEFQENFLFIYFFW